MSNLFSSHTMDVVELPGGRFGIRIIGGQKLPRIVGNFETREEADAWLLQQTMLEDEAAISHDMLTPGPSLDVV